jgi:hypothetical protein
MRQRRFERILLFLYFSFLPAHPIILLRFKILLFSLTLDAFVALMFLLYAASLLVWFFIHKIKFDKN